MCVMGIISASCVPLLVILVAKLIFREPSCHFIGYSIVCFAPAMYFLKLKYNLSVYIEIQVK